MLPLLTRVSQRQYRCAGVLALGLASTFAAAVHADEPGRPSALAREILSATGVKGGLVVHLGCGDGALTAALRSSDSYLVQGLDADRTNVARARKHLRELGLYGKVSAARRAGRHLPYADNLVNLVVAEDLDGVEMDEVLRVLVPGGVAYVRKAGTWTKTIKPRPEEIDHWTHYFHGPNNNAVARDTRVGPPRHLQWKSPPEWCRSHDGVPSSIALVLSAGGRLFSVVDEGLTGQPGLPQRWTLVARDAFNGVLLWKKPLSRRLPQKGMVATAEKLYVVSLTDNLLSVLDAATGKALRTYKGTKGADELVCSGNIAVLHVRGARRTKDRGAGAIVAVDLETGRILWERPAKQMARDSLAVARSRVCYHVDKEVICVDLQRGEQLWRVPCNQSLKGSALMVYHGAVLVAAAGRLRAHSLESGEFLWKGPGVNRRLGMFGAAGLVWLTDIQEHGRTFLWTPAAAIARGYDPLTGQVERSITVERLTSPGHHLRCYPAKATERYLLLPKRGVEFVDLQGDNHMRHDWLRAPCGHGVIAANGLLYAPPHQCFCYPGVKLAGFNALAAEQTERGVEDATPRLQRGPAYDWASTIPETEIPASDWPLYRHDVRRSGRAGCVVPLELERLWQADLGGRLSQPVVADGRLLIVEENSHAVRCLDAETGQPLWIYTADGRIDSPPAVHLQLVLFGSTDGSVYCLRARDGELAWRFRAAPGERRIVVSGQLESAWPVHGSVLVQKGTAYAAAGRSSFLDGGIRVYALDPATGKVLHDAHLSTPPPDVEQTAGKPFDMEGARTDLLVSDGTDLYMFFVRFAPDLSLKPTSRITKLGDREVGLHLMSNAGFLDSEWFDRSYWTHSRRWPGYYFGYNAPKTGQILVFDDETTYGLHVFTTRQGHSPRFWPGREGYELFADSNDNRLVLRPTAIGREKGSGYSRMLPPKWSVRIPVRARAMVLAGTYLYLAGPPDVVPEGDPYAAIEGRKGGRLWVVSTEDGERLAEYDLDHPPVFDGLVAARGRLYLATTTGRLIAMGAKR